jgi:RecB family endonuclease NucS
VRLVVADCAVDYSGRLSAHLPLARRLLVVKADGSVLVHSDGGSYKPLNWMSPPCALSVAPPSYVEAELGVREVWTVQAAKSDDRLVLQVHEVFHDSSHDLGVDPGLVKDGVEAHLQRLLAEQIDVLGDGHVLVRREYPTAIGPVDILARAPRRLVVSVEVAGRGDGEDSLDRGGLGAPDGARRGEPDGGSDSSGSAPLPASAVSHGSRVASHVAIEVKRHAGLDAVEQLTRYLALLNRDPLLAPVRGVLAAQTIAPQARVLAEDRGIGCLLLDYDAMRGVDDVDARLF